MYDVVIKKFAFAISSPDELLVKFGVLVSHTPFAYQGQIWRETADHDWPRSLCSVACARRKTAAIRAIRSNFQPYRGSCTHPV